MIMLMQKVRKCRIWYISYLSPLHCFKTSSVPYLTKMRTERETPRREKAKYHAKQISRDIQLMIYWLTVMSTGGAIPTESVSVELTMTRVKICTSSLQTLHASAKWPGGLRNLEKAREDVRSRSKLPDVRVPRRLYWHEYLTNLLQPRHTKWLPLRDSGLID